MKKILGIILINIFLSVAIFAQEEETANYGTSTGLTNKKGLAILPAGGDYAIGADALPYLRYVGNLLSGYTGQNSLSVNSMNIYGRYYLSMNTALRITLYTDNGTDIVRFFVQDDAAVIADPLSQKKVIDKRKRTYNDWELQAGLQKFRGYGRLQGFYGFSVGYGHSRTQDEFQYGNEITEANQSPTTVTNWGNGNNSSQSVRLVMEDFGISHTISAGPVCGVEFYFAPKMCIGAEANIMYSVTMTSESDDVVEEWENGQITETTTENSPGNLFRNTSTSGLGAYGGLYVMFHF